MRATLLAAVVAEFEHRQERLLRDLDAPDLLHPLLSLLLALEELALARDVAAVALGGHVLAEGLDGLAGDDVRADRGLDRDVVLLARDLRAQLLGQRLSDLVCRLLLEDKRLLLDGLAWAQDVELGHVRGLQTRALAV